MKVIEYLQDDFVQEFLSQYKEHHNVLFEEVDDTLLVSQALREGDSFSFYSLPLYVVTRAARPEFIIETGVQNGGSSQAILCALKKNDFGHLYSIDSGRKSSDGTHSLTVGVPGQGISDSLRDRWTLFEDFSFNVLPTIDKIIPRVDLFFHDSDHSKENVEYEFNEVKKLAHPRTLLGLHDHYGQWDHKSILPKEFYDFIIGYRRPERHSEGGRYHNVLRVWRMR